MTRNKFCPNRYLLAAVLLFALCGIISCRKYLDAKPSLSLEIPSNLSDLQALLDNYSYMNGEDPDIEEISADCHYSTYSNWLASSLDERQYYTWDPQAGVSTDGTWYDGYKEIFYANTVLDNLQNISDSSQAGLAGIKGAAFFFRAYALYNLAQIYSPPYDSPSAAITPGMCLRLSSSATDVTKRSSVQQTYFQILQDLHSAALLLPDTGLFKTRPGKAAVFGEMARVYLSMGDYLDAKRYSDSCLKIYNSLIDFNSLDTTAYDGISIFNREVIFHSMSGGSYTIYFFDVDSVLFNSYSYNDLRKPVYYYNNGDGTWSFMGSYGGPDGPGGGSFFDGIAVDEIYLIKAECEARNSDVQDAMNDLNLLLNMRWRAGTYIPYAASSSDDAIAKVLLERKKELVLRGTRWSDLRRLNRDVSYADTLIRNLNGNIYTLDPNDARYTILIPSVVISSSGIQQNRR